MHLEAIGEIESARGKVESALVQKLCECTYMLALALSLPRKMSDTRLGTKYII